MKMLSCQKISIEMECSFKIESVLQRNSEDLMLFEVSLMTRERWNIPITFLTAQVFRNEDLENKKNLELQ